MQKILWINENELSCGIKEGLLIDPSEIEEKVYVWPPGIRVWEVNGDEFKQEDVKNKVNNFTKKAEIKRTITVNDKQVFYDYITLEELLQIELEDDELEKLLDIIVGSQGETYSGEYVSYTNHLAFDFYNYANTIESLEEAFFAVDDMDSLKVYEWHNGKQWVTVTNINVIEYELELAEDQYDLDVYDGQNWSWGGRFSHAKLQKIIAIDGEKATDKILFKRWTQYQDNHITGEIITCDEVIKLLTEEKHPEIEEIKEWLQINP